LLPPKGKSKDNGKCNGVVVLAAYIPTHRDEAAMDGAPGHWKNSKIRLEQFSL
jgi:hypothetical protein